MGPYFRVRTHFFFFCTTEIVTLEKSEKETKHVHVAGQSGSKIIETIIE